MEDEEEEQVIWGELEVEVEFKEEEQVVLSVLEVEVELKEEEEEERGGGTGDLVDVVGRGGVHGREEEEQVIWGELEVEVEFEEEEEEEQVIWWMLEAEVEFEEEEQVVLSVGGRVGVQGRRGGRTGRFECVGF